MSLGNLTIDERSLRDYGIWINGSGALKGAAPDVTTVSIPGRSGDLVYDNERFENITIEYPCVMRDHMLNKGITNYGWQNFFSFRNFLYSDRGYRKLVDTYRTDGFRMGRITGALSPSDIYWDDDAGYFTLKFDCKPQFFLNSGEERITVTGSSKSFEERAAMYASPLIDVYGSGVFTIDSGHIFIIDPNPYDAITLDFELSEAYYGEDINCNQYVHLNNLTGDYPKIKGTGFTIHMSAGSEITKLVVQPRWWSL